MVKDWVVRARKFRGELARQGAARVASRVSAAPHPEFRGPTVYVSPFTNTTNLYIELQKQLLRDLGFEVEPFSLRELARGAFGGLGGLAPNDHRRPVVALHWLETRLFPRRGARVAWSWKGTLEFAAYLAVIRALRCHTVYFVHNHAIHDGSPWQNAASKLVIRWLREMADARVVHDPSFCADYHATYLPHPLYWDAPPKAPLAPVDETLEALRSPPTEQATHPGAHRPVRFGIMGAIRPYKRIDQVLSVWPASEHLTIRGKGDPAYVVALQDIVRQRGLTGVDLVNRFLSDVEVNQTLRSWDVVILPQMSDSMLVSGAFFEAVGVARVIIMRDSPFARWCKGHLTDIWTFSDEQELAAVVAAVGAAVRSAKAGGDVRRDALRLFGWDACLEHYGAFWRERAATAEGLDGAQPGLVSVTAE